MPVQAKVIQVTRPGDGVSLLVEFQDGASTFRETVNIAGTSFTQQMIRDSIIQVGQKHLASEVTEASAKGILNQVFTIPPLPQNQVP